MMRWLRALFAWRVVRDNSGVWLYSENSVTGYREARRVSRCFQPIDIDWLRAAPGGRARIIDVTQVKITEWL